MIDLHCCLLANGDAVIALVKHGRSNSDLFFSPTLLTALPVSAAAEQKIVALHYMERENSVKALS
jgi:hypothetical protein